MALTRKIWGYSLAGAALTAAGTALARASRQQRRLIAPIVAPLGLWRPLEAEKSHRVGVVYNPAKVGSTRAAEVVQERIAQLGWPAPTLVATSIESPGTAQARELAASGHTLVIAIGGDGTVGSVARGLLNNPQVSMGIIPAGTGNLLARNLYLPIADLARSVDIALNGVAVPMDAINLQTLAPSGISSEHTFFVMSGAGFDAQVMNDTSEELKAQIGWLAYAHTGLRGLVGKSPAVRISIEGRDPIETHMKSVLIANCGRLQGGLQLANLADLNDGQLEVIVTSPRTLIGWSMVFAKVMRRTILGSAPEKLPFMQHYMGTSVRIEMLDGPQPVEIDGDIVGHATSLSAQVLPEVLRVQAHPDVLSFVQL